jgi:uncharacterized protein (DUF2062 family)
VLITGSIAMVHLKQTSTMQAVNNFRLNSLKLAHFFTAMFSKKNIARIAEQFYNPNQTDEMKAISAAVGFFVGILPIWGFQTLVAIFLATLFKLNKPLVIIFSQVSFPPLLPLVVLLSFRAGSYWVTDKLAEKATGTAFSFSYINQHFDQYLYGSISFAVVAALTAGCLTFAILKFIKIVRQRNLKNQLEVVL